MSDRKYISILFKQAENSPAKTFVEVEDENGKSFGAGEWISRADGLIELRLTPKVFVDEKEVLNFWQCQICKCCNLIHYTSCYNCGKMK